MRLEEDQIITDLNAHWLFHCCLCREIITVHGLRVEILSEVTSGSILELNKALWHDCLLHVCNHELIFPYQKQNKTKLSHSSWSSNIYIQKSYLQNQLHRVEHRWCEIFDGISERISSQTHPFGRQFRMYSISGDLFLPSSQSHGLIWFSFWILLLQALFLVAFFSFSIRFFIFLFSAFSFSAFFWFNMPTNLLTSDSFW